MGQQRRFRRRRDGSLHVHGHRDFLDDLAQLDQLGRAGGGVGLQLATLRPPVGIVVTPDVAQDHILAGAVEDDPQVEVDASRPEIGIPGVAQPVHAQPGLGRIGLQVKGGGLGRPLLLVGQPAETRRERVGDAELHEVV